MSVKKTALATGMSLAALLCLAAQPAAAKTPKVVFIPGVIGDVFYTSVQCGIEAEARAKGVDASVEGPQRFDPSLQKPVLDSVVASHPDAIIIAPTDAIAMRRPVEQALKAGIKVVLVDEGLADTTGISSQVSSDNMLGGKTALQAFREVSPGGGKVLLIGNQPGVSTTDERLGGFREATNGTNAVVADTQFNNNDPAQTAQIVSSELQKTPDLAGVFAATQPAATGAATGIRQNHKGGSVKLIAFDASPDEASAVENGTIQALVAQEPAQMGKLALDQAIAAIEGKPVEKTLKTGFVVITAKNVKEQAAAVYQASCH